MNIFQKIKEHFSPKQDVYFEGFKKTDERFGQGLFKLLRKKANLDTDFYQELNQVLIESDVGVEASKQILKRLEKDVKRLNIKTSSEAIEQMVEILLEVLIEYPIILEDRLNIILMVGVNGSGRRQAVPSSRLFIKHKARRLCLWLRIRFGQRLSNNFKHGLSGLMCLVSQVKRTLIQHRSLWMHARRRCKKTVMS